MKERTKEFYHMTSIEKTKHTRGLISWLQQTVTFTLQQAHCQIVLWPLGQPHSLTIYTTIKMSHDAQFENDYKGYVGKFKPKIVSSEKTHTLA